MYKEVKGDIFDNMQNFDVLVHGCNCFCTMGAGIAKTIKQKFPEAYEMDLGTEKGDINKLGTFNCLWSKNNDLYIVNAYTQYDYSSKNTDLFYYDGWKNICKSLDYAFEGLKIAMPKIGSGLAGGDWERISQIIKDSIIDCDVTVYYL